MVLGVFLTEIVAAFCLAATLLYKYGNIFRHHIIVTVSVLIAWYFSLLIIFILPLDVSSVSNFNNIRPINTVTIYFNTLLSCRLFLDSVLNKIFIITQN